MPEFPIIHSQQFKNWFGNSKIVDNNGNPLVVWHGLKNPEMYFDSKNKKILFAPDFDEFSVANKIEIGAWFSPDESVARLYGTPAPFFLYATNPIQEESPLENKPEKHDAIFRMRSNKTGIWNAWEIAVFHPSQIMLAFDKSEYMKL